MGFSATTTARWLPEPTAMRSSEATTMTQPYGRSILALLDPFIPGGSARAGDVIT